MTHADGNWALNLRNDLAALCPNIKLKAGIRQLLIQRIVALTSNRPNDLKQQVDRILNSAKSHSPTLTASQSDLASYAEGSTKSTLTDKKDQITAPGEADEDGDPNPDHDGNGNPESAHEDDQDVGIIYARVSSDGQTGDDDGGENANEDGDEANEKPDEGSIQGQISELEDIAEKEDIALPYEHFTDEAETGTDFDRDEIQRVFEISKQKDIDYLLVEKIDRIGRNAPETLYFISLLQRKCGVTLITPKGEKDIQEVEGLMHTTLMSLMAEIQNTIRTKKATKERIRGFLEKKNWNCKSPKVPLGYSETDDGWLEVDPDEKPIVREIFEKFNECETYAATEEHIINEFGAHSIEGHAIKTILQEPAYIGHPKVPEDWLEGMPYENDLDEPELHLLRAGDDDRDISEETFEEVQEVIAEKDQFGSTDEETYTIEDFIEHFGLFPTVESSVPVKLIHHCGEPLVKDGQVDLGGKYKISTHRYKCPACEEVEDVKDYYRKWPLQLEAEKMEIMRNLLSGKNILEAFGLNSGSDEVADSDTE